MTEEEIRKLAREYAEDIFGKDDYPFKEDDMCNAEDDFESVVTFLSKKFCVVEKEKVKKEYSDASNTYWKKYSEESQMDSRKDVYERGYNVGIMNVMKDIFGSELFKDMEK